MSDEISLSEVNLPNIETLKQLAISESGFVFNPSNGYSFNVNETGLHILKELQKETPPDQILQTFLNEYHVTLREAERDVIEYIGLLRKQLEGSFT
jgi:hypothetical protein